MDEQSTISRLMARTRKFTYSAVSIFGIGYCLIMLGYSVLLAEEMIIIFSAIGQGLSYSFYVVGAIFGILLGITIVRSSIKTSRRAEAENTPSQSAEAYEPTIDIISASVYIYSLMIVIMEIGDFFLTAEFLGALPPWHYLFSFKIVGAVLLSIGFRLYRGQPSKSKSLGAIIMMVSMILIYLTWWSWFDYWNVGMFLSAEYFEVFSLLMAIVGGLSVTLRPLRNELKWPATGIILSISGLIFSIGLLYFVFSFFLSNIYFPLPLRVAFLFSLGSLMGGSAFMMTWWLVIMGIVFVGISGILAFVKASISAIDSTKQSYMAYKKEKAARTSPEEL